MTDETSPDAPTAGAPAVPPSGDQAGATEQSVETPAAVASAEPAPIAEPVASPSDSAATPSAAAGDSPEESEGELHRLISNGLHIFGKIEHWTAEEIAAFVAWLESRL